MSNISKDTFNKFKEKVDKTKKKISFERMMIFAFIILLIVAVIVIILVTNKTKSRLKDSNNKLPDYAQNFNQDGFNDTVEEVKDKGEMRRMKIYLGDILDNVDKGNYDEIYARLDEGFKENFFPRQKVLEDYLKGEFPKNPGYVIKNFERMGSLYVYIVDIMSVSDSKKKTDMKFVFEEYGLNDYKFSFSRK